jgi:hypothetical protein
MHALTVAQIYPAESHFVGKHLSGLNHSWLAVLNIILSIRERPAIEHSQVEKLQDRPERERPPDRLTSHDVRRSR